MRLAMSLRLTVLLVSFTLLLGFALYRAVIFVPAPGIR